MARRGGHSGSRLRRGEERRRPERHDGAGGGALLRSLRRARRSSRPAQRRWRGQLERERLGASVFVSVFVLLFVLVICRPFRGRRARRRASEARRCRPRAKAVLHRGREQRARDVWQPLFLKERGRERIERERKKLFHSSSFSFLFFSFLFFLFSSSLSLSHSRRYSFAQHHGLAAPQAPLGGREVHEEDRHLRHGRGGLPGVVHRRPPPRGRPFGPGHGPGPLQRRQERASVGAARI